MLAWLPAILKYCIATLIFALGLGSSFGDLTYLVRRPGLLLRSLLAMYVLVPLAALASIRMLPLMPGAKAALLVLAVSAGAPLLSRRLSKFGGGAYPFSLVVVSSLLAIVLVPTWVALLGRHFGREIELSFLEVAMIIGRALLLPLIAGMAVRALNPTFFDRVSDLLMKIAGLLLIVMGAVVLVANWRQLLEIHSAGMLTLICVMVVALAIGHALGGPTEEHRTTLAIACATRHLALAVLVASAFPDMRIITIVAAYGIASMLVSLPYLAWRRHKIGGATVP